MKLDYCTAQICAYGTRRKLILGTTFSRLRLSLGSVPLNPMSGSRGATIFDGRLAMKTERFAGHNEAREALMLSVASVTAIMLTAYLILLILY
jgi:hypothetical protein